MSVDLAAVCAAVEQRLGLQVEATDALRDAVHRRLRATGLDTEGWLALLGASGDARELQALAADITVGETYFFRDAGQLTALVEVALPDRLRARSDIRALRLLSLGCASGEEPYTLAMLARAHTPPGWDVAIRAVDINRKQLERAALGRYTPWSLRVTSQEIIARWFRRAGTHLVLDPTIRSSVTFEARNLMDPDPDLWVPGAYDIVLCRNVLMYFSPRATRGVVSNLERCVAPGGYLFLGHAESLRGLSEVFGLHHTHETFYYQRQPGPRPDVHTTEWHTTIRSSADRVDALAAKARRPLARPPEPPPATPGALESATELLRQERYDEALGRLTPAEGATPDGALVRAAVRLHRGDLAGARAACSVALAQDALNVNARCLLALCHDAAGEAGAAAHHHRLAAEADPTFAIPRLHLGILARRAGDKGVARAELTRALSLLASEDDTRLALFGGGFSRSALITLCRAELDASGGDP